MPRLKDLTGQRFGRLEVLHREGTKWGHVAWRCKCECGKECVALSCHLTSHQVQSCGCLRGGKTTHGCSSTRLYRIYAGIIQRCYNANNPAFQNYGGRGIVMCDLWLKNFESFKEWAISHGYDSKLTIDRIDVNGNYEPKNCHWATKKVQENNKTSNRNVTFNGETHTIKEWSEMTGINYMTLRNRIMMYGWNVEKAMTTK